MTRFTCIPAIDLRGGRCVRLLKGDFAAETLYGDPVAQAVAYEEAGAELLHVVDLDAARTGTATNRSIVLEVVAACSIPVQLGGGIRNEVDVDEALGSGLARVVVGTAGVEDPALLRYLAGRYPGQVVAGLDHRLVTVPGAGRPRRVVAVRGWEEASGVELEDALGALEGAPLAAAVVTDIGRDGTLQGPDIDGYEAALSASTLPIVASGGTGSLGDLSLLAHLEAGGRRLAGVVVGRALLSGAFGLAEAIEVCRQ